MALASEAPAGLQLGTYDGLELASDPLDRAGQPDYVGGAGPGARLLARLTIRRPVRRVLDLGTGGGIQALLAARHANHVVGVDISDRALAIAESNARRNGVANVEWRRGSWLQPVRGEHFDLVLANPPYVISPESDLVYRDSGEPDDTLVLRLLADIPGVLEEGGFAAMLCNWVVGADGDWRSPLEGAVAGSGCDAVFLRSTLFAPEDYAAMWNREFELRNGSEFRARVERWTKHYRDLGIEAIALGFVALRRRFAERNWTRAFVIPAAPTDRAGEHVERLFSGWDWVRAGARGSIRPVPGSRLVRRLALDDGTERISFEVRPNVGFAVRVDEETAHALANGSPLSPEELRRLAGLGMLLTPPENKRKIEVS
jgi:methylase of polypeptide subunit release factors